jgi:hypothetical protein
MRKGEEDKESKGIKGYENRNKEEKNKKVKLFFLSHFKKCIFRRMIIPQELILRDDLDLKGI